MTWEDWIPALSTSTALGVIGFALGVIFKAEVERRVQHRFDKQLEELRSKLNQDEEEFRANLRRKDEELAALRSGALSGLMNRNAALDNRRLEAAQKLWEAVVNLRPLKSLSEISKVIKMDAAIAAASDQSAESKKMREFGEFLWRTFKLDELPPIDAADRERLFISPDAWAHFLAYRAVLGVAFAQIAAIRGGLGSNMLSEPKSLFDMVTAVMPHLGDYLNKNGLKALPYIVDILENALFQKLFNSLDEQKVDEHMVERAARINEIANRFMDTGPKVNIPESLRVRDSLKAPLF